MPQIHAKCFKYCLIALNLIFALLGLIILMLGFWFRFDPRTRSLFDIDENAKRISVGIYVMWAAGSLLLVAGIIGYLSVTRQYRCMIWIYLGFLILLFLIEMGVAIWAFVQKDQVIEQLQTTYIKTAASNNKDVDFDCMINAIHKTLDCCGYLDESGQQAGCNPPGQHKDCGKAIEEIINSKLHIFAATAFGIALVTVLGIILTILFQRSLKSSRVI
ncbi:CD9 antigen-like [Leucoraja erinacea]|uniref:CD9 antigen-like n=1 Tax=Leucoraja erinaceus TaxID=7782 RepID=UPI0024537A73|nr:CD9 antigen-like [Leucoraja erinacea]